MMLETLLGPNFLLSSNQSGIKQSPFPSKFSLTPQPPPFGYYVEPSTKQPDQELFCLPACPLFLAFDLLGLPTLTKTISPTHLFWMQTLKFELSTFRFLRLRIKIVISPVLLKVGYPRKNIGIISIAQKICCVLF